MTAAGGGYIAGPGTSTSDSIPARLSNGEYVIRAAAVPANRSLLDAINYGGARGYAAGGPVGMSPPAPRAGGSGVQVNIINNAGAQVTQRQRQNADGSTSIDVMVDQIVAKKLTERGTASSAALRRGYGAQQALTNRG